LAASALVAPPPVSAQTAGISGQIRYYASGQFTFGGLAQGTWTIEPSKQGDVDAGMSTLDAVSKAC
jgi:hypothetical protein